MKENIKARIEKYIDTHEPPKRWINRTPILIGLLLVHTKNREQLEWGKIGAKVGDGSYKRIKYSVVIWNWIFNKDRYQKFIKSL